MSRGSNPRLAADDALRIDPLARRDRDAALVHLRLVALFDDATAIVVRAEQEGGAERLDRR